MNNCKMNLPIFITKNKYIQTRQYFSYLANYTHLFSMSDYKLRK